jgi:hypothetical protein
MAEHLYAQFLSMKMSELEAFLLHAQSHTERAFWRALLDLRLQIEQEKVLREAWSEGAQ